MKCPGQDTRYWKKKDIFEIFCPFCSISLEFFKDDSRRRCKKCKHWIPNPRLDLGCLDWCDFAEDCLGNDIYQNIKNDHKVNKEDKKSE